MIVRLHLKDSTIELSSTMIMGNIDLNTDAPLSLDDIYDIAEDYKESGATFLEFSVNKYEQRDCSVDGQLDMLCAAIEAVNDCELIVGVYTSNPEIMTKVAQCGAQFIVDPNALRAPGAIEAISSTGLAVCMLYDQQCSFKEEDDSDPCAAVSEFFYERLDACMNAGIDRQKIILEPMIGVHTSVEYRLKIFGRLKTFVSFGLPLSCSLPRLVANESDSNPNEQNMSIVTTVALFAEQQGIRIIRTKKVYDIAVAINSWHALHQSARPFKLTRAIGEKLKNLAHGKRRGNANKQTNLLSLILKKGLQN